ncbi:glycosyltransferase [Novipirellula sp.]|uniref:glycosyltransferase n=1 Tax=Novipirellula sp. TaxID=2795430 RepID=UPI003564C0A0
MASLRITHVTKTLDSAAGGVPVVAIRLAAAAAEVGHQVTLVAEEPSASLAYERTAIHGFDTVNVQFCEPVSIKGIFSDPPPGDALVKAVTSSDVVHMHGVWDPVLVRAGRIARQQSVPYLVAPHGMLDPWSLQQARVKKRIAMATTHRSLLAGAALMHALNATEAELWGPLKLNSPTTVIPNGIDLRDLPVADPQRVKAMRERFGIKGRKVILFLGRLHYKKGLDVLAAAFLKVARKHDDVSLLVVGPDGGARGEFESEIVKSQLHERVHIVGPLFGADKYDALWLADLFCLPSRQEGFSIAILEAIACGLPVVISQHCHFDAVRDADLGRVCDLDADKIAAGLCEMLQSDLTMKPILERGPQWVEDHFSWKQAGALLLQHYERCLRDSPHSNDSAKRILQRRF